MSKALHMRFPGGLAKALTLSYDDNVEQDVRMIEILNQYGIKATFNLNSGVYAPEGTVYEEGKIHRVMSRSQVSALYTDSGHEVAVHAYTHPFLEQLPQPMTAYQILKDREALEEQFGCIVRGMAYPYGTYSDEVVEVLRVCGIIYARTTHQTLQFKLPTDWLRLHPTCHHKNPKLKELTQQFCDMKPSSDPRLFYVWGHTYEFESDNNWHVIEEFCQQISGREDIWYATNREIYEYTEDYHRLVFSVNGSIVHNPTARTLYFVYDGKSYAIAAGETKRLGA